MRRSVRIGTALALAVLAAGAAIAFSLSADGREGETATALVRFDRYQGTLGTGLEGGQNVGDGAMIARSVGRKLGLQPRTVERSVRVLAEPATGVVTVTATRPTAEEARELAGAFMRELIGVRRPQLGERAREARRYVRFLLAEGRQGGLSGARRQILREEEALLTDFLSRVRARDNPVIAQDAQVRAGSNSRAGLLSGLLAAAAGLVLALAMMWLAGGRRDRKSFGPPRSDVAKDPAEGSHADPRDRPQAAGSFPR